MMVAVRQLLCVILIWLNFGDAVQLEAPKIGVPESVRVWSALKLLLLDEEPQLLSEIYPVVTQLQDDDLYDELLEDGISLTDLVSRVLSEKYQRSDIASLLPLYCQSYPMGIISEESTVQNTSEIAGKTFFELNNKRYHNSEDVFYLKSSELKHQSKMSDFSVLAADDVVIGTNKEAPIVIFYGCTDSDGIFEDFNRNLFSEAINTGKLRYVWRSTCILENTNLDNFPLEVTVEQEGDITRFPADVVKLPEQFNRSTFKLYVPTREDLSDMDLKVASMISEFYKMTLDYERTIEYAKGIINNFPLLTEQLASSVEDTKKIIESNKQLNKKGIDYQTLGLYINGQNWKISSLDQITLLDAVRAEYVYIRNIHQILETFDENASTFKAQALLRNFSQISLSNLRDMQPIKIDLHRIQGFSESIIYFNDIELDVQYHDLTTDIESFFKKSKFGEIPEYRCNWNELIFVIDFDSLHDADTQAALEGLNRAIKVMAQGYPQRIGLLPLSRIGTSSEIIRKLYELKGSDLLSLEKYLENLLMDPLLTRCYNENVPNFSKVLSDLQIFKTSVIINGEIYPFKRNTWHYLVAKIIKKDTAFLKRELSKLVNNDKDPVDVRNILHMKSANTRHNKYTPDYFSDATYTFMNNSELNGSKDRILEYIKGDSFNVLHTVTLVDDFNTKNAIERLRNLMKTNFSGVRIRIIHFGSVSTSNWKKLERIMSKELPLRNLNDANFKSENIPTNSEISRRVLSRWLPGISRKNLTISSFMVLNGRVVHFENNEVPNKNIFDSIIKREAKRTLDVLYALDYVYPNATEKRIEPNFIEMLSAALTKIYYQGTQIYHNGIEHTAEASIPRMDFSSFHDINNYTSMQSKTEQSPVEVLLILDPLEERSQKLLSLAQIANTLSFVNCKVILLPAETLTILPISRIYLDQPGIYVGHSLEEEFQVEVDAPSNIYITSSNKIDGILVEVHAFMEDTPISIANIEGLGGLCLMLIDEDDAILDSCVTMETFGYGQFICNKLNSKLRIKSCDSNFQVISISTDARSDYLPEESFTIRNFNPLRINLKVAQTGSELPVPSTNEEINIYSVLQNNKVDEENYQKMILSILLSDSAEGRRFNFWVLDQPYISETFKRFCSYISEIREFDASIEFIRYKWPLWMRPQRFNDRRMDAFKILFADVIFPLNISKLVYMDPSPTPIDVSELYTSCEFNTPLAMFRMRGSGYWNEGYWSNMLSKNRLKFHSLSPAMLINLEEFRRSGYGHKLRLHYQRLTADLRSLVKIDQDLINDLQLEVPITNLRLSQKRNLRIDSDVVGAHLQSIKDATICSPKTENGIEYDDNAVSSIWHDEL